MKTRFLFPHRFQSIGWILLVPGIILGIVALCDIEIGFLSTTVFSIVPEDEITGGSSSHWIKDNLTNEIAAILFTIGALFAGFSRQKNEDEYIASIRLESLMWATYINYALLFLCFIFVYGIPFLTVMVYNMFTLLIIFLLRFYFLLYKTSRLSDEK